MKKPKIYFMTDDAQKMKEKVLKKIMPPHIFYGGIKLEKERKAKIINSNLKNILKLKKRDIIITNRTKYIIPIRILGIKIILINMNSNHDLIEQKSIKGKILYLFNILNYKLSNFIICLSEIQIPKLKNIGVKNLKVIPLGVDYDLIKNVKLSKEYYISSGGDLGKNHNFVANALKGFNLKILTGKPPIDYIKYLNILGKSNALILNIDPIKKGGSDLSGVTTCSEALLMRKPIFINNLPWLKELLKENYYVYKDTSDLKKILQKKIKFKKINYNHFKLKTFSNELLKVINQI